MSLNGDTYVMRNGRSTSQISIYNYPEHLNPFYEDDQHKRLRFWHVNKSDNNNRRNSFSLSGLKDIWAFKSFRLKKKSSTLGINKTSESPPPLRRDIQYNTPSSFAFPQTDRRARHSTDRNCTNDMFHGNRSSLQNMNTAQDYSRDPGFNRNVDYRRTIQNVGSCNSNKNSLNLPQNRRYVYGGSVTPQPLRNSEFTRGEVNEVLSHGSSQTSICTNPFDSDYDEDVTNTSNNATSIKKVTRKKRRAPAPPVPVHNINGVSILSQQSDNHDSDFENELHIEEDLNIANLTAEIESFVKTTTNNDPSNDSKEKESISEIESTRISKTNREPVGVSKQENLNICTRELQKDYTPKASTRTSLKENSDKNTREVNLYQTESKTCIETANSPSSSQDLINNERREAQTISIVPKASVRTSLNENMGKNTREPQTSQTESGISCIGARETSPQETINKMRKESPTGQLQCIHVHIDTPKTIHEKENIQKLTSFQPIQTKTKEIITEKTAFTVTNPPTTRRTKVSQHIEATVSSPEIKEELIIVESTGLRNKDMVSQLDSVSKTQKPTIAAKPKMVNISIPIEIHKSNNGTVALDDRNSPETSSKKKPSANIVDTEVTSATTLQPPAPPLKIVESAETSDTSTNNIDGHSTRVSFQVNVDEKFDHLYRSKESSRFEWKKSTLAPLEEKIPPEKRKSVKDIIESINRSQRLLHASAHKEISQTNGTSGSNELSYQSFAPESSLSYTNANNFSIQDQQNSPENQLLEIKLQNSDHANNTKPSSAGTSNDNHFKLDNDQIFKKCRIDKEVYNYRETSPTASNLDWNPVPKPKRTKNLSDI